jgi:hypothetical protein
MIFEAEVGGESGWFMVYIETGTASSSCSS